MGGQPGVVQVDNLFPTSDQHHLLISSWERGFCTLWPRSCQGRQQGLEEQHCFCPCCIPPCLLAAHGSLCPTAPLGLENLGRFRLFQGAAFLSGRVEIEQRVGKTAGRHRDVAVSPSPVGTRPLLTTGTSPRCLLQDVSREKEVNPEARGVTRKPKAQAAVMSCSYLEQLPAKPPWILHPSAP